MMHDLDSASVSFISIMEEVWLVYKNSLNIIWMVWVSRLFYLLFQPLDSIG